MTPEQLLKVRQTIALLSSMVDGGEDHSESSNKMQQEAYEIIDAGITTKDAVDTLVKALSEDKEYFYSWQANIAMQFKDSLEKYKNGEGLYVITPLTVHEEANAAAVAFLNLLVSQ